MKKLLALATVTLAFLTLPGRALAYGMSIDVGGVLIQDNTIMDTNPTFGAIDFNTANPGPIGFTVPQGYDVSGSVKLTAPAMFPGAVVIDTALTLTNFVCSMPVGAPGGTLVIDFQNTFTAFPATWPTSAYDGIDGFHACTNGQVGAGNVVEFASTVNGVPVAPPASPFVSAPAGGSCTGNIVFSGGHGPLSIPQTGPPLGPPWTVDGVLKVTLGVPGDEVDLPTSAEVGVGNPHATAVLRTTWGALKSIYR